MSTLPLKSYLVPDTCAAIPHRSPFSRSGFQDAGLFFFYVTNRNQWSVMLDSHDPAAAITAADLTVSSGRAQLWVLEKMYSSRRAKTKKSVSPEIATHTFSTDAYNAIPRSEWAGNLYIVLREPYQVRSNTPDSIAYHDDKMAAITDADIYTLHTNRRAVVGLMRADISKY